MQRLEQDGAALSYPEYVQPRLTTSEQPAGDLMANAVTEWYY